MQETTDKSKFLLNICLAIAVFLVVIGALNYVGIYKIIQIYEVNKYNVGHGEYYLDNLSTEDDISLIRAATVVKVIFTINTIILSIVLTIYNIDVRTFNKTKIMLIMALGLITAIMMFFEELNLPKYCLW